jgi:hypothetical protein
VYHRRKSFLEVRARPVRQSVVPEDDVGLMARESEAMLDLLWEHVVRPE